MCMWDVTVQFHYHNLLQIQAMWIAMEGWNWRSFLVLPLLTIWYQKLWHKRPTFPSDTGLRFKMQEEGEAYRGTMMVIDRGQIEGGMWDVDIQFHYHNLLPTATMLVTKEGISRDRSSCCWSSLFDARSCDLSIQLVFSDTRLRFEMQEGKEEANRKMMESRSRLWGRSQKAGDVKGPCLPDAMSRPINLHTLPESASSALGLHPLPPFSRIHNAQ